MRDNLVTDHLQTVTHWGPKVPIFQDHPSTRVSAQLKNPSGLNKNYWSWESPKFLVGENYFPTPYGRVSSFLCADSPRRCQRRTAASPPRPGRCPAMMRCAGRFVPGLGAQKRHAPRWRQGRQGRGPRNLAPWQMENGNSCGFTNGIHVLNYNDSNQQGYFWWLKWYWDSWWVWTCGESTTPIALSGAPCPPAPPPSACDVPIAMARQRLKVQGWMRLSMVILSTYVIRYKKKTLNIKKWFSGNLMVLNLVYQSGSKHPEKKGHLQVLVCPKRSCLHQFGGCQWSWKPWRSGPKQPELDPWGSLWQEEIWMCLENEGKPTPKKNTVYHVFTIQIVLSVYPIYRHKNLELSVAVWLTNKHRVRQTKIGDEPTRCQRLVWRVCDLNPGDTPSGWFP